MTRKIVNLTFDGHQMTPCDFGFWMSFVSLASLHLLMIHRETGDRRCYWEFTTNGKLVIRRTASGVIAARNNAFRWFNDERTARVSGRGKR